MGDDLRQKRIDGMRERLKRSTGRDTIEGAIHALAAKQKELENRLSKVEKIQNNFATLGE